MTTSEKRSPNDPLCNRPVNGFFLNAAVAGDFNFSDRKMSSLKASEEVETDLESYGSSSEDMENYSPKSVVTKARRWSAAASLKNVDVNVSGLRVHSQVLRIRAEDSHLGEDIGECVISKIVAGGDQVTDPASHHVNVLIFSRPASPLSGKATSSIKMVN